MHKLWLARVSENVYAVGGGGGGGVGGACDISRMYTHIIYTHRHSHTCDVFKWLCRDDNDDDDAPRVCVSHVATVHIVLIAAG